MADSKKGFTPLLSQRSQSNIKTEKGEAALTAMPFDYRKSTRQKVTGFTLLELLIVIGILAILATLAILVLNPAELLRRARDTQRLSDLTSLRNAIGVYVLSVQTGADMDSSTHSGTGNDCVDETAATTFASAASAPTITGWTVLIGDGSGSAKRAVDGTGWVPIKFTDIGGGAPLARLPVDPTNDTASLFYTYTCKQTPLTFELSADMESALYTNGGPSDKESTDGGTTSTKYEVGTEPGLSLGPY